MGQKSPNLEKPIGRGLGWERQETSYPLVTSRFKIRQDRVRLPQGQEITYAYMETQGAVFVVPLTDHSHVILIHQYRYPSDDWCWEVPAGGLYDHDGSLEALARRELMEEVGATCGELEYINWFYGPTSALYAKFHVLLARDARVGRVPEREETEFIRVHSVPVEEALTMARRGRMKDGPSALALFLCEPYLVDERGLGRA